MILHLQITIPWKMSTSCWILHILVVSGSLDKLVPGIEYMFSSWFVADDIITLYNFGSQNPQYHISGIDEHSYIDIYIYICICIYIYIVYIYCIYIYMYHHKSKRFGGSKHAFKQRHRHCRVRLL